MGTRGIEKTFSSRIVARGKYPGIKADEALNIVGAENIGKSKAIRALGDPWYTDQLPRIGNKDAQIQMAGKLVLEIGDGTHVDRISTPADLKNFPYQHKLTDIGASSVAMPRIIRQLQFS